MIAMPPFAVDVLGYVAAALVLLAFSLRSLVALRSVAIASNVAFIAYALGSHLPPVLLLHAVLVPVNAWRLWQCLRGPGARQRRHNTHRFTLGGSRTPEC